MALLHSPRIVTDGLVLCLDAANRKSYPGSGTVWRDLSGRGSNGTLINTTFNSINRGCLYFNGTSYVTGPIQNFLNGEAYSSLIWVNMDTIVGEQHFLNLSGNTNNGVQFYSLDGVLGTFNYGDVLGGTVFANRWYMLVQTKDSSGNTIHYINGKVVAQGSLPTYGNSSSYVIGNFVGGGSYFLKGNVSCAMMYKKVLTSNEILQNYNALKGRFNL